MMEHEFEEPAPEDQPQEVKNNITHEIDDFFKKEEAIKNNLNIIQKKEKSVQDQLKVASQKTSSQISVQD